MSLYYSGELTEYTLLATQTALQLSGSCRPSVLLSVCKITLIEDLYRYLIQIVNSTSIKAKEEIVTYRSKTNKDLKIRKENQNE